MALVIQKIHSLEKNQREKEMLVGLTTIQRFVPQNVSVKVIQTMNWPEVSIRVSSWVPLP
jgi:hypothetical protein